MIFVQGTMNMEPSCIADFVADVAAMHNNILAEDGCGFYSLLVEDAASGLFAVNDRCTHQAALISNSRIRRGIVMCPLHGARFEVANGTCVGGTYRDLRTFPLRVAAGMIEVCIPDGPPGMEDLPVAR